MAITKLRANSQVAEGTVDSYNIKNRSILPEDLAEDTFSGAILQDGTIDPIKMVAGATYYNGPGDFVRLGATGVSGDIAILPALDGSLLYNLKPLETISTQDLTDVDGPVNTAGGLAKYDNSNLLALPGSISTQGYVDFNGVTEALSPVSSSGRLYYRSTDKCLHFINEDGLDLRIGNVGDQYVNNYSPPGQSGDTERRNFVLPVVPFEDSLCVNLNGLRQTPDVDYHLGGNVITMANAVKSEYELRVDYRF